MYVAIGQKTGPHYSENATPNSRQGRAHISYDFETWSQAQAEALLLPEPLDLSQRGGFGPYDQVHVGIGTANYNNVTVGLYGLWHNQPDFRDITCDLTLAVSNDGLHFRQVVQGMPYIDHRDSPLSVHKTSIPQSILTQGNGIVSVGDKTLIYHGRWTSGGLLGKPTETGTYELHTDKMHEYYSEIALAEIPRDRWGGLGVFPNSSEGHAWTAPVRLPHSKNGFHISLNGTALENITVDIATHDMQIIEDYRNGKASAGDGFDSLVSWENDIQKLAGEKVRLRIHFKRENNLDARLYAINIDDLG